VTRGRPTAVIYLADPADAAAAALTVAGRPVVFRSVASAVRAGAERVLVPERFRDLLTPALASAPRVARAITWLHPSMTPPDAAVLVPATAVVGVAAVAAVVVTPPPAVHPASRDAGIAVVHAPAPVVSALWAALVEGEAVGSALATLTKDARDAHAPAVVQRVRDADSAREGERRLYTTLGSAIDTRLDAVFHRAFSRHVSRAAVACGITPNTVTIASLLVGLVATWLFWNATPVYAVLGLVAYAVAVILDHADGEVARLTLTESAIGEWLDIAADTVIHAGVVLAMGVTSGTAPLGILAAAGVIAGAAVSKVWPVVGTALSGVGNRDGFYAMLLGFIVLRAYAPSLLPWLMVVVALGTHAYWVARVVYRLTRGA